MFVGLPVGHGASVTVTPMRSFSARAPHWATNTPVGVCPVPGSTSAARDAMEDQGSHIPGYNVGHQVLEDVGVSPQTSRSR